MARTKTKKKDEKGPELLAAQYLLDHGRLPRLGEDPAPWKYRGWLLFYVQGWHAQCPMVSDRWGYYRRTVEAGRLLDEPIPQLQFGQPDPQIPKLLQTWARIIGWDNGGWSDFRTLLEWLAWGLGFEKTEPKLHLPGAAEKLYREVNMKPFLDAPYDYLGAYISEHKASGWNPTAFFPTPHQVCELMARMLEHDESQGGKDIRLHSVHDPCIGTGRFLLHASNVSLNLSGQDVDFTALLACKINGCLYAPWMTFPLTKILKLED